MKRSMVAGVIGEADKGLCAQCFLLSHSVREPGARRKGIARNVTARHEIYSHRLLHDTVPMGHRDTVINLPAVARLSGRSAMKGCR